MEEYGLQKKMSYQYYHNNPGDKESLHYYLNNRWDYTLEYNGISGITNVIDDYYKYIKLLRHPKSNDVQNKFVFITIQDFKRRECDIEKLKTFIRRIAYVYDAGFWIIESGKQSKIEDCNFHIHMLVKIKKKIKNHKQVLNSKWTALFDTDLRDKDYYQIKQWRQSKDMPSYDDWVQEKKDYFSNDLKLSHKNSFDLELHGTFD